jgi:bifunctional DNA-binding transcriptional regulator/antitoxin component of YhaV-PrlF toxin-antitoxin module
MKAKILSVEFEISAQSWIDGRFSIPAVVADLLGKDCGDRILLEVTSKNGTKLFLIELKSGIEIYGLSDHVSSGELLRAKISNMPFLLK